MYRNSKNKNSDDEPKSPIERLDNLIKNPSNLVITNGESSHSLKGFETNQSNHLVNNIYY